MQSQALIGVEEQQSEGSYDRSRFNAVKHGLTAKTAVLPGEDREFFQSVVEVYRVDLKTQNQVEDDLAENAALAKWQMTRAMAAQSARIDHELLIRKDANSLRDAVAAAEIRSKLFHDRQGPIELYPSRSEYFKGPRTSCSDEPADPLDPIKLILQAESTVAGCQMLLREWEALRRNLLSGLSILSHEKLKMLRLMGKQPIQAVGDPEVAQVFLACHALEARYGSVFHELRSEIEEERFKTKTFELKRWEGQELTPGDPSAARAVLLGIMDAAIERLRLLERERQELAETVAKRDEEKLREEERKREDQTLRHIDRCSRLMVRSIETIRKGHRDEERGWGRTRRTREERKKGGEHGGQGGERRAEGGGEERERSGNLVEAWPGYEAEVQELRRKRQRELDALNAPRVQDYARWKPPVVEELTQGGEDAANRQGTDLGTDELGVTALVVEEQGERVNTQNEICDGPLSVVSGELSQMTNAGSGETVDDHGAGVVEAISAGDSEVFIEGGVTVLTLDNQGERANIQNGISGRQLSVLSGQLGTGETVDDDGVGGSGDGGDGSCDGETCRSRMEGSHAPARSPSTSPGHGPREREFNASDQIRAVRPMERLFEREKRRRRSRELKDAVNHVVNEEELDSLQSLLPNSVAVLRDYYASRNLGDFARRHSRRGCHAKTPTGNVETEGHGKRG